MKERFYSILPMPLDAFSLLLLLILTAFVFWNKFQLVLHSIWVSRCQISHVLACYRCIRTKKWGKVSFTAIIEKFLSHLALTLCDRKVLAVSSQTWKISFLCNRVLWFYLCWMCARRKEIDYFLIFEDIYEVESDLGKVKSQSLISHKSIGSPRSHAWFSPFLFKKWKTIENF